LSRNFYTLRFLALFLAFAINFILLFYKVSILWPQAMEQGEGRVVGDIPDLAFLGEFSLDSWC
jgi:ryanodine receptor 1